MDLDAPARPRWFAGLRRSRSRMLGGVASGFADFWAIDPMLLRVLLVSPMVTAILSLLLTPWAEVVLGPWVAVGITQLLWIVSGLAVVGYVVAWILIPQEDRDSVARRFLGLGGSSGTLLKFLVAVGAFILVAWLGLVLLGVGASVVFESGAILGLLVVLGVTGLVLVGVWVARGGDLRESVARFGSPGFGRDETRVATSARDSRTPTREQTRVLGPDDDPTFAFGADAAATTVLDPDGNPTTVLGSDGDPTTVLGPDADLTTGLGPDGDPTTVLGPDADPYTVLDHDPTAGYGFADSAAAQGATDPTVAFGATPGRGSSPWVQPAPPQDAVDRARAAATAAADARAAAAEADRRQRIAENRARRAAARAVRKERNRWGKLVAAVTLLTAGALFLTDRLGMTELGALQIGVISVALLAGGILVGAWFGSARWLILPALLLAGVVGVGAFLSQTLDDAAQAAPITWAPESLPADESHWMHWDSGDVTVDLTEAGPLDGRSLSLDVDRGALTVLVPEDQWVAGSSTVLLGTNHLDPGRTSLFGSSYVELSAPSDHGADDAGPLSLNLTVDVGELNLIQKES